MRISIIVILCSALVIQYVSGVEVSEQEWKEYKVKHGKVYNDPAEDQRRLEIYKKTKHDIIEHNKRYEQGLETFEMGINQFSDLEPHEIGGLGKKK